MPIGIIVNCCSVFAGGILGGAIGQHLPEKFKLSLPKVFGLVALAIAINLIIKVKTLSAVALAVIFGTIIGESINLHDQVEIFAAKIQKYIGKLTAVPSDEKKIDTGMFTSVIVLFCASGSGIYGALEEGFTGIPNTLMVKSILDFFTAIIFGSTLGYSVASISALQCVIMIALFGLSRVILPGISPAMLADFSSCGGLITLGVGLNILQLTKIKIVNMIPSLLFVMTFSNLWNNIFQF